MPGARTFARSMKGIALASVVAAVLLFAAVSADAVDPVYTEGNPTCPAGMKEFKIDGPDFSNGSHSDGTLTVTITKYNSDTATFDWSSNIGVDKVIVKGGDNANVYNYNPESTGDTGLHTPLNPNNNKNYGLSHVSFCYDVETPPPSESPSPSVSPSETETPSTSPSPSVSPSETGSASPSVSVLPSSISSSPGATVLGKKLTKTGADVIRLALFALALVVLGVAAYVISTRARRNNA
ncbi:MAG: hypothetical protein WAT66_02575 [Actinomycetota bacterium]